MTEGTERSTIVAFTVSFTKRYSSLTSEEGMMSKPDVEEQLAFEDL